MKKTNWFGVLFLVTMLCLGSCTKKGPAGPQGPQGSQGPKGEQGLQGIPGAAGSIIYSGESVPAADVGKNGDYYLDKSTGNLYGPKTDTGWGDPVNLKGPKGDKGDPGPKGDTVIQGPKGGTGAQGPKGDKGDPGQDGKDGSQILSGTSAPTASVGNTGDYYWNASTFTLYGPKSSSGWGTGIELRGPKGDKGEQGPQGIQGDAGSTIYSSEGAPAADLGKNGDYYLNKSTSDLYGPKTDTGWGNPVSLKGQKGDKGDPGQKGDTGAQGNKGDAGQNGDTGAQGPKGDQGQKGDTGAQGSKGDKGDPGQNGKDGSQILSGASAPTASIGNTGDYYWNMSDFALYGPKSSSGWGNGIVLRGPKGDKGDPGTANVMYSKWMSFVWQSTGIPQQKYMKVTAPKLTQDFLDKGGSVFVYLQESFVVNGTNVNYVYMLPHTFGDSYSCRVDFSLIISSTGKEEDGIYLKLSSTNERPLTDQFKDTTGSTFTFRYVLIPGGVPLRRSSPPPSPKDYKAFCEYYRIPE